MLRGACLRSTGRGLRVLKVFRVRGMLERKRNDSRRRTMDTKRRSRQTHCKCH